MKYHPEMIRRHIKVQPEDHRLTPCEYLNYGADVYTDVRDPDTQTADEEAVKERVNRLVFLLE